MADSRTQQLERLSYDLGMSFAPKDEWGLINLLEDFQLFRRGRSRQISNMLRRRDDFLETDIRIFDYAFTTGAGKSRHRHRQTVFFVNSRQLGLPQFWMKPENILHKIGDWFGIKDIDFEEHPEFSRQYFLKGPDEDFIRAAMNEQVLRFFTIEKYWHLEGINFLLLLYRHDELMPPKLIRRFYEKGVQVFEMLKDEP